MTFTQNGPAVSVRTDDNVTRLYGGAITDLDNDGWVDFIAVNEISADLRVLLNTADGSGHSAAGADSADVDRRRGEPERRRRFRQ